MTVKDQITEDMKQAMRDRDSLKLNTLRFMLSEIKNKEIDEGELSDDNVQKVIAKTVKSMKDAIEEFKKGGRDDIVQEEKNKVIILEAYLPKQLTDEELQTVVDRVVADNQGAQMGQVIGLVMKEAAGKADGGRVSAMVRSALN